ncbi:MAG: hypothetical protein ACTHLL_00565 [Candidatus Nitrosocosmicus sp.]
MLVVDVIMPLPPEETFGYLLLVFNKDALKRSITKDHDYFKNDINMIILYFGPITTPHNQYL